MTAAAMPQVRDRWRMGIEARAMVLITAVLLAFGLAVLYSASAMVAVRDGRESWFYLIRQLSGLIAGVVVFAVAAKMDAERWSKWAWPLMGLTVISLSVCILPFVQPVNGSRRFLIGRSLQPSELGKLAVVIWTAMLVVKKGETLRRLSKGILPFVVVVGVLDLLVILEPDLSVAMMYTLMVGVILFAAGARVGHFVLLAMLGTPLLWHQLVKLQYVLLRLVSFFNSANAPAKISYQLNQSLIAVGSGGAFGRGFGQGRQQLGFVPFAYDDFIGANIGEEWGFAGIALLVIAFAFYGFLGFRISRTARSPFLQLVAIGLTVTMVITAYIHIGVVVGLLPTTGLTLPFISYGRSNLVLSLFMTGMLVNIGSMKERVHGDRATDPLSAHTR
jgi:cell division protein FtsW